MESSEFEGTPITETEARLPALKVVTPEAYKRGTILRLTVDVRVKSVRLEENRDGGLTRSHVFAVESINVDETYDPAQIAGQMMSSGPAELLLSGSNDEQGIAQLATPIPDYPSQVPGQSYLTDHGGLELVESTVTDRVEALEEVGF